MLLTRRQLLGFLAGASLGISPIAKAQNYRVIGNVLYNDDLEEKIESTSHFVIPKALKEGSRVAITSPASPISIWELRNSLKALQKLGLKTEIGETVKKPDKNFRYLSAPDSLRAEEFMNFIKRKDIDAILCGRGGYGTLRVLSGLDFDVIRENPKIIMGYSDITALLNAIHTASGLVTFHGPVANSSFPDYTLARIKKALFYSKEFKAETEKLPKMTVLNKGKAVGKIAGGNLSMVAATIGTPYQIDTNGALILLEEVSEEPYKIDKMLTQMLLAGMFENCTGIGFGYIKNLDTRRNFYPGISFTVRQVIEDRIKLLGLPSCINLPFGHLENKLILPFGIKAELDCDNKTFTILEQAVSQ